jgi:hypothetical protein
MLLRIAGLMENLRQVSSDIAHDLRTPLSRLRQDLEEAREKEPDSRRLQEFGGTRRGGRGCSPSNLCGTPARARRTALRPSCASAGNEGGTERREIHRGGAAFNPRNRGFSARFARRFSSASRRANSLRLAFSKASSRLPNSTLATSSSRARRTSNRSRASPARGYGGQNRGTIGSSSS